MKLSAFLPSIKQAMILLAALFATSQVMAQTAVGQWKTIDDETGEVKSIVTIQEDNGVLTGKVMQIMDEAKRQEVCKKCDGSRKNQPIEGMTIIWNMKDKDGQYEDGKILDPENGKVYSANMKVLDGGKKLEVRGFIGFALIGRSQVWEKVEG